MDVSIFKSPKRKRDDDLRTATLQTSGLSRNFNTRRDSNASESETGGDSPRMMVAGKFQKLDLRNPPENSGHDRKKSMTKTQRNFELCGQADQMNVEGSVEGDDVFHFQAGNSVSVSQPISTSTRLREKASGSPFTSVATRPSNEKDMQEGSPIETPMLMMDEPNKTRRSTTTVPQFTSDTTSSQMPAIESTGKGKKAISSTHAKSLKTSSLTDSNLWWSDSEISGYSPQDPDEDDYGVNGVGYQKPASVAEALRQKRRRQIEEYRRREAGEARAARRNWRARSEGMPGFRGSTARVGKGGCRSTMSGSIRRVRIAEMKEGDGQKESDMRTELQVGDDEGTTKEGRNVHFGIG